MRSVRTLFIALVVVALSAGVAMAGPGAPSEPAPGLAVAAGASGETVPAVSRAGNPGDDQDSDDAEDASDRDDPADGATADAPPTASGGGNCVDPTSTEAADANHGALVCWAAHQETPEGFANHGAYVSSIARDNHGHDTATTQGAAHRPSH